MTNILHFKPRLPDKGPARRHPPMINLPPVTKILIGVMVVIHVAISLLTWTVSPIIEQYALAFGGFSPVSWTNGMFLATTPFTPFTYAFLHASWLHLGVNMVMMAAAGSGLERMQGGKFTLIIFLVTSLLAAIAHWALMHDSVFPVVGASGGISGLFGALIYRLYKSGQLGTGRYGLWPTIGIWLGISILFGLTGGPNGMQIAWAAHIGGFLAGLGLAKLLARRVR